MAPDVEQFAKEVEAHIGASNISWRTCRPDWVFGKLRCSTIDLTDALDNARSSPRSQEAWEEAQSRASLCAAYALMIWDMAAMGIENAGKKRRAAC